MLKHFRKVQVLCIVILSLLLFVGPAFGEAVINLSGYIEPENIEISIDSSQMILDIPTRQTSASDSMTISNTSLIPVKVSLVSITPTQGSWNPEMITDEPETLSLVDAQNKARFRLTTLSGADCYRTVDYSEIAPVGYCSAFKKYVNSAWEDVSAPVDLGTIAGSDDGTTPKTVVLTGTFEVSKKRILSKAFDADMMLNFSVENI